MAKTSTPKPTHLSAKQNHSSLARQFLFQKNSGVQVLLGIKSWGLQSFDEKITKEKEDTEREWEREGGREGGIDEEHCHH